MDTLISLSPIILMFVIFYFLLIRPQQKRQKQVRDMQTALQKGDAIVTIGGLHGVVDAIDENTIVINCNNTKLTFDRAAVREVKQD
ncbi:preprotein translocase subunit YajC [Pseudogracilibacillus sp. SE30717A]|uniref:preprotein translocase subunit YajC n=1 Tax=Pseudogracilibacillus sp. SE30717A TaxID=3098293 RepID=UPI00300E552C